MRAFICDACKKIYKPYYKCADGRFGEGNALTIVKIEKDGQMRRKLKMELCPTCMADVFDYIQTDLIVPDAVGVDQLIIEDKNSTMEDEEVKEDVNS